MINALQVLLNADDGASQRQVHGVDSETTFAFSGEECVEWYGHREGDHYTVAGNMLTGENVLEAAADAYEATAVHDTVDPSTGPTAVTEDVDTDPLAKRLIDALAAGDREGGDKREELPVQSAAVVVETTEDHDLEPPYNDLRIDATETPIADRRETYELAQRGYRDTLAQYEGAFEADSLEEAAD